MTELIGSIAFILILIGITQWFLSFGAGFAESRRADRRDWNLETLDLVARAETEEFTVVFLIAALDEEAVIGTTVRAGIESGADCIVVVDDGSDDRTAELATQAGDGRVVICRQDLPDAQQGKGAALNAGYALLVEEVHRIGLDPAKVIVVVMDADGRLSPGAVDCMVRLFRSPRVGATQLPVRIRNTGRLLTDYQDYEFWGMAALPQLGRNRTHTVSLGGNGQFSRLSALLELGRPPWTSSLTEDLDLAISLLIDGWEITTSPNVWVDQQAIESLPRLIRQRTRWMQGHMKAAARIGEIWRSERLPNDAVLEVTSYLISPILLILPWSVIFTLGLKQTIQGLYQPPGFEIFGSTALAQVATVSAWYVFSFFPLVFSGLVYAHRREDIGRVRALLLAHGFVIYNYVTFLASWKAVARILLRRDGWSKTARVSEPVAETDVDHDSQRPHQPV